MKNKLFILALTLFLFAHFSLSAQVGINTDNSNPNPSAMLDVKSTDKGMLTPRMSSIEREAINNPADGLMVFDLSTESFWYFDNNQWIEIHNRNQLINGNDLFSTYQLDFDCLNIVNETAIGTETRAMDKVGSKVYIIDSDSDDLKIYDVGDPNNPVLIGSIGIGPLPVDIAVSGNYAYVIDDNNNDLKIIDVSDPNNLSVEGSTGAGGTPTALAVSGAYVYVVDGADGYLRIFDTSLPTNPSYVGNLYFDLDLLVDIVILDSYAFIIDNTEHELTQVDISNPAAPYYVDYYTTYGYPRLIKVYNSHVYIVLEEDLKIYEYNNNDDLVLTGEVQLPSGLFGNSALAVSGNYAYVAFDGNLDPTKLQIVDVSDVSTPTLGPQIELGSIPVGIAIEDNYAYITDEADDVLRVVQLSCRPLMISVDPFTGELQASEGTHNAFPELKDSDSDTKIQVEQINDEDHIRFDVAGSEAMLIDSSGNVGIGTELTDAKLAIDVGADTFGIMIRSAAVDNTAGMYFSYGTNPDAVVGVQSDADYGSGGNGGMQLMAANGRPIQFYVKKNATGTGLFDTEEAMRINGDGKVGIGRTATTNLLEVEGNASKSSAGDWLANSDARLKTNIRQLNSEQVLQKLLSLQGVTYEWADDKTGTQRPDGIQYGFTAQNIQQVFPSLVEEDALGYLQTAYGTYDAMYVEAIRALQQQITELKTENEQLKADSAKVKELAQEVAQIKSLLQSTASTNQ